MDSAEVSRFFFSLESDQATQVVLYLCNLILRLIRAQPKGGCCTSSGTTVSSPTGTPLEGQGGNCIASMGTDPGQ